MSGNALEVIKEKIAGILAKYPVVDEPVSKISAKVGVDKEYLVIAAVVLVPILLMFALSSADFLIDMVGFVYPLYGSIKAIESKDKEDDTMWLTYWLVFALFKIIEGFADSLISFIPFYMLIKAAFLVWCFYPTTQGAKVIYSSVVKPYLVPHVLSLEGDAKKEE